MEMRLFILAITLVASLSPLLTFTALWQIKEWRMDRLRAHLKQEGWLRQLFGIARPVIVLTFFLIAIVGWFGAQAFDWSWVGFLCLLTFILFSAIQILTGRQPRPVWTAKALALVVTSLLLDAILTLKFSILNYQLSILLVLLQPLILLIAWALWKPVETLLKRRIIRRATATRSQFPDLTVIGITGSAGKTTTKELLAHILADRKPLFTPAHVNSEIGVAQWLLRELPKFSILQPSLLLPTSPSGLRGTRRPAGNSQFSILIAELGAYQKGEIALLCQIVKPTIGIVTFIGSQHLALFGSQDALCSAKSELLEALPEDGHAFLNSDSALCSGMATRCRCPVTTVGTGGTSDLEAFDVAEEPSGISFRVGDVRFFVPLHGTHNVTNVLLAIACARYLTMELTAIAVRLRTFRPPSRTFEIREERGVRILDDTHNASAASFRAAIAWARTQPFERKTLLTSGLIELGEEQERTHEELGLLAKNVFQNAIVLNKKSGEQFARGFGKPVTIFSKVMRRIPAGSLLVCVGRMTPETIHRLLP